MKRCVCGCGRKKGLHKHHCVTQAELRRVARSRAKALGLGRADLINAEATLVADPRNIVLVAYRCHQSHHGAGPKLPLRVLPDSVFTFALEVLGAGPAYEYLRRHHGGDDPRLDALLEAEAA